MGRTIGTTLSYFNRGETWTIGRSLDGELFLWVLDLIDEDDLKEDDYNKKIGILDLDVFHLCCHQYQRGRLLALNVDAKNWGDC